MGRGGVQEMGRGGEGEECKRLGMGVGGGE